MWYVHGCPLYSRTESPRDSDSLRIPSTGLRLRTRPSPQTSVVHVNSVVLYSSHPLKVVDRKVLDPTPGGRVGLLTLNDYP